MPEVFVGIGSNIEPELNLRRALAALRERFGAVTASSVYRSRAFGFEGDDFLNMAASFTTAASPAQVDEVLSAIEYAGGRVRAPERFGPRTLDLDLLIYGCCVDPVQRLPRDDVGAYLFVLGPLAEIAPGLVHPIGGYRIADRWAAVRDRAALERVAGSSELVDRRPGSSPADAATAVDR